MANLSTRWWLFNDREKHIMHAVLEYRLQKKVPIAILPFYDCEDVYIAVEVFRMRFAVPQTKSNNVLLCKLGMFPIMRLITYWVMGI